MWAQCRQFPWGEFPDTHTRGLDPTPGRHRPESRCIRSSNLTKTEGTDHHMGERGGAKGQGPGARLVKRRTGQNPNTKRERQKQQRGRTHTDPTGPLHHSLHDPWPNARPPKSPCSQEQARANKRLQGHDRGRGNSNFNPGAVGLWPRTCGGEEAERPTALSLTCPLSVALYPYSFAMEMTLTLGAVRIAYMMAHPREDRKAWGAAHDGWGS